MSLIGTCGQCGRSFASNPNYVPSTRLPDGQQVIFCRDCVEAANPIRQQRGLQPIIIHPLAYEPEEV